MSGETRNISSGGFLCLVRDNIPGAAQVRCAVTLPRLKSGAPLNQVTLNCAVEILRREAHAEGVALACKILRYTVDRRETRVRRSRDSGQQVVAQVDDL